MQKVGRKVEEFDELYSDAAQLKKFSDDILQENLWQISMFD